MISIDVEKGFDKIQHHGKSAEEIWNRRHIPQYYKDYI
jgi:hypothetical protein